MRVLLTIPRTDIFFSYPDIGLGYVARNLLDRHHEVLILDYKKDAPDDATVIASFRPQVIGIKVYSKDRERAKAQIANLRQHTDAKIVVGGYHITSVPKDLPYLGADYSIAGDGSGFGDLVEGRPPETVANLIWMENGKLRMNERQYPSYENHPGPAWRLINPNQYSPSPEGFIYKAFPIAPIITTLGCPFPCSFCSVQTLMGKKLRHRSLDCVVDEMKTLLVEFGVREFHINDDNFTADKKFAKAFCRAAIDLARESHKQLFFSCPNGVRIDCFDDELLSLMRESGFYSLSLGLESGSQRILDHMGKKLSVDEMRRHVDKISKYGFNLNGFFIIGYPVEKRADIEMTVDLALSLPLDRVYFNLFSPLPATRITSDLGLKTDYLHMMGEEASVELADVTVDELKWLQRKAMARFFLRPRTFFHFVRSVHLNQIPFLIKRTLAVVR